MACRAVRQGPLNSFQMVLKQNAAIVGDVDQDCPNSQCDNQRFDKLRLSYVINTIKNGTSN